MDQPFSSSVSWQRAAHAPFPGSSSSSTAFPARGSRPVLERSCEAMWHCQMQLGFENGAFIE